MHFFLGDTKVGPAPAQVTSGATLGVLCAESSWLPGLLLFARKMKRNKLFYSGTHYHRKLYTKSWPFREKAAYFRSSELVRGECRSEGQINKASLSSSLSICMCLPL